MNKKYILFLFIFIFAQVCLHAITKEEYLKEFQELDNSSPEHACLEENSFGSCEDLMYEFGKPVYLEKIRTIISTSSDTNTLEQYLQLEQKLPIRQRDEKMFQYVIEKLRSIGTKDALFVVYQKSGNLDDLEMLVSKIGDSGKTGNHELMREYYIRKVKNLKQLPSFLEKFKGYETRRFKEKALAFSEFGKNLTIDNFFNSIEYKYVLKELGYTLKYRSIGQKYNVVLTPNGDGKEIIFSFNANCQFSNTMTQRENVGFFEGFGSGGATEKDVSYNVEQCKPLKSQDKSKIYNLYASSNQLDAFNQLKNATWSYKIKTGQSYIANTNINHTPPVTASEDKDKPIQSKFGNYECTFKCYKYGGVTGLGKNGSSSTSVNISASSNNEAQKKSHDYAKKLCHKMGYDGVLSQWGTGSTDCSSK